MALQGDLASFALSDVLQLLASTQKSGRLVVSSDSDHGELWLQNGQLTGGSASSRPSAAGSADVIFEILQFSEASFIFDENEQRVERGEAQDVGEALKVAAGLQAEWDDVITVVPSLDHWITMAPELAGQSIVVNADQWKLLAGLGGGASVRTIGERFEESDLLVSQRLKALAEAKLVDVGEPRALPSNDWADFGGEQADQDEHHDVIEAELPSPASPEEELVRLSAEAGPLVLESSDDALLPEPLPGAGTAFTIEEEADDLHGISFGGDASDDLFVTDTYSTDSSDDLSVEGEADANDLYAGFMDHLDGDEPAAQRLHEVDHAAPFGIDAEPTAEAEPVGDSAAMPEVDPDGIWEGQELGTSEEAFARAGWDSANPPVDHLNDANLDENSDRSSLLKFLSNVKS